MDAEAEKPDHGMRPGAIAGGAILLVIGGTMLLDRSGVVTTPAGQLIGPLILITLGALTLAERGGVIDGYRERPPDGVHRARLRRRGGVTAGLWLIGIGIWMLVSQTHLWGLDYHTSWPVILVFSGVIMLVKGIR